jgi:hypothetical protein
MSLAGVSLDERLTDAVAKDATTGVFPHRRIVGTTLIIELKYHGDEQDDVFTCDIVVQKIDGWTSIGSAVSYLTYESHHNMEFYDRYRRGVNIQFLALGEVTQFDYVTMMNTVVQGLVLLQMVEQIVLLVALYALPESPVYLRAQSEPFKHTKAMAEFGVQAALACQAFNAWDTSGHKEGEQPSINEEELMAVFKGHFDDKLARRFVSVIMKEARGDDSEGDDLSCRDLVRIMSSGLVSTEELNKLPVEQAPQVLNATKISPTDDDGTTQDGTTQDGAAQEGTAQEEVEHQDGTAQEGVEQSAA